MDDFEIELKTDFLQEAVQILDEVESAFLDLERDPTNKDMLNRIFRFAHNLKGTSRAVGFGDIAEFTHELENLILQITQGQTVVNAAVVSLLLACKDRLAEMITGLQQNLEARFENSLLIEQLKAALAGKLADAVAPAPVALEQELTQVAELLDAPVAEEAAPVVPAADAFEDPTPVDASAVMAEAAEAAPLAPVVPIARPEAPQAKEGGKGKAVEEESIRVSLSKVEKLIDFVGEMVILQTVLEQMKEAIESSSLMKNSVSQLGKISREIQELSMGLRMIPLKNTFQKMNRIVRDTSKVLNKQVDLRIQGEDTEIDKTVLEHLSDPLVHIIRNAIDHGLETPEERVAAGKSPVGVVELWAYHEGSQLVIEISDDGKGIDPARIFAKAVEKGLVRPDAQLSEKQILDLIFHPGFSTKDQISEVSGRGVGMDVVKTNIERVSGTVGLVSVKGMGSNFKITLPLTMAIVDAMVVEIQHNRFIIPLAQIKEAMQLTADMVEPIAGYGKTLNARGESYPLIDLGAHLGLQKQERKPGEGIAIIVNHSELKFSVMVDDILRQQQVVVKKLGKEVKGHKGVVASSILGDGKPAFILDLMEFIPAGKGQQDVTKTNRREAQAA